MIDSGNTLRNGVGIADEFREKKMDFKLSKVNKKPIGTANKESKLVQIGETEEIRITITGLQATWTGKDFVSHQDGREERSDSLSGIP